MHGKGRGDLLKSLYMYKFIELKTLTHRASASARRASISAFRCRIPSFLCKIKSYGIRW